MNVLQTTNCHQHEHAEFRIAYDPTAVLADDVAWLARWLEQSVGEGARYRPGQTCQVGWMITEVRQDNNGNLTLWEPDLCSLPVKWSEGVTQALAHLRIQKDAVESVFRGDDLSFPSMLQSAIVCTQLGKSQGAILERTDSDGADSGWFCGCRDEEHNHNDVSELTRVSLYEAALQAPLIIPFLAFPSGVLLSVDENKLILFHDGRPLNFRPGSYLARRYGERQSGE